MGKIVYATFSTWVTPTVQLAKGEAWDADDPVVKSHPDWFADSPPEVRTSGESYTEASSRRAKPAKPVEQATAAPGEKRTAKRA